MRWLNSVKWQIFRLYSHGGGTFNFSHFYWFFELSEPVFQQAFYCHHTTDFVETIVATLIVSIGWLLNWWRIFESVLWEGKICYFVCFFPCCGVIGVCLWGELEYSWGVFSVVLSELDAHLDLVVTCVKKWVCLLKRCVMYVFYLINWPVLAQFNHVFLICQALDTVSCASSGELSAMDRVEWTGWRALIWECFMRR